MLVKQAPAQAEPQQRPPRPNRRPEEPQSAPGPHAAIDRALRRARQYHSRFSDADLEAMAAHFAVVNTGSAMARAVGRRLAAADLNQARYSLLRALYFSPEKRLPQNEVAREMGTSPPNVTQLLDALERDGLVARVLSEADRRVTYAELTPKGEETCARLVPEMVQFMEESIDGFSTRDMVQLRTLLTRLRLNLERYLPGED